MNITEELQNHKKISRMKFLPEDLKPVSRIFKYKEHINSDKSIYWSYTTTNKKIETDLNVGGYDVSKARVAEIHKKALGYNLEIDPTTYKKPFIKKSINQGVHDVEIHTKNIEPKDGFVYQRLLNNSTEYRYFYSDSAPCFCLKKTKVKNDFSMAFENAELCELTAKQNESIHKFCKAFGLNFTELDILIERGKVYIIDVNNVAGNGELFSKFKDGAEAEKLYIKQLECL